MREINQILKMEQEKVLEISLQISEISKNEANNLLEQRLAVGEKESADEEDFTNDASELLAPNSKYFKDGQTYETDDNGNIYKINGKLSPNLAYVLNGNAYKTDEKGRIIICESNPHKTPENMRDINAQTKVGGKDRKSGDQGGHIVGRDMGGDGGLGNLIPMDSRINQSDYKRMEKHIDNLLKEKKDVFTKTEIEYAEDSDRPSKITTTVTVNGKDTVYIFDNNLEGSLMNKLKETCSESDLETVQDVLDENGGQISSIKEEYGADRKLERTIVTITYTDDNGQNYRRHIVIDNNGGATQ